jgi:hypothetical protein
MEKEKTIGLPDGQVRALTVLQARRVWQIWLVLAPIAASRGEGVAITVDGETVAISTVYAPLWESVGISVGVDGSAVWCAEQSAPDVPVDFLAPAPIGPWESPPIGQWEPARQIQGVV